MVLDGRLSGTSMFTKQEVLIQYIFLEKDELCFPYGRTKDFVDRITGAKIKMMPLVLLYVQGYS